jgi:hypothetical protein
MTQIYGFAFFRTTIVWFWQFLQLRVSVGRFHLNSVQLVALKENLHFYISTLQKCNYHGLKSMLEIQFRIMLNLDHFGQIQGLQGTMAVLSAIFHAHNQFGIWVVANLPDLTSLILHLWIHSSTDKWFDLIWFEQSVALKKTIFKQKKGFASLSLGLIYYSIASSQPPSWDTVPLISE